MRLILIEFPQYASFCCAIYGTNVQIERTWRDSPRAYICRSPFHYEKIIWENSDIKWMKVPSINSVVTNSLMHALSFLVLNYRRFLGRLSTNLTKRLFIQIQLETNVFLSTKVIWEREKRGIIGYLLAWGNDHVFAWKYCPAAKTRYVYKKMTTKVGMYSATHESVTVTRG